MLLAVVLVVSLVGTVSPTSYDEFISSISSTDTFAKCLGYDFYYGYLMKAQYIKQACLIKPLGPSPFFDPDHSPDNNTIFTTQKLEGWQASFEPVFKGDFMRMLTTMYHGALTNLTCALQGMDMLDGDLNLLVDNIIQNYRSANLSDPLTQDLVEGVNYCSQMSSRLPLLPHKNLVSLKVQRVLAYRECELKARSFTCYKEMLRNSLYIYDTTALPDDGRTSVEDRLANLMKGCYTSNELSLFL